MDGGKHGIALAKQCAVSVNKIVCKTTHKTIEQISLEDINDRLTEVNNVLIRLRNFIFYVLNIFSIKKKITYRRVLSKHTYGHYSNLDSTCVDVKLNARSDTRDYHF